MQRIKPYLEQIKALRSMQLRTYAGSAAFFLLLSFFPLTSLLLGLLHAAGLGQNDLYALVTGFVPKELEPVVEWVLRSLDSVSAGGVISLSTMTLCVSASAGVRAIQEGLNSVCRLSEHRSYSVRFSVSVLCMLGILACITVTLLLQISAPRLLRLLPHGSSFYSTLHTLLEHSQITTMILLTVIFSLLYLILPDRKTDPLHVLPGAAAAAGCWILFSFLFSFYLDHFSSYSKLYGGLATAVILMLWLYICMTILLFGELFNRLLFRRNEPEQAKPNEKDENESNSGTDESGQS